MTDTTEIPEMFRALFELPFTLPNYDDHGEWLQLVLYLLRNRISELGCRLQALVPEADRESLKYISHKNI